MGDLTGPGIKPQTFRTDSKCVTTELTGRLQSHQKAHKTLGGYTKKERIGTAILRENQFKKEKSILELHKSKDNCFHFLVTSMYCCEETKGRID